MAKTSQPERKAAANGIDAESLLFRTHQMKAAADQLRNAQDAVLTLEEKQYLLRRVEKYRYGDQTVYTWALCVEKGEDDTWGS